MKVLTANVNGLRARIRKKQLRYLLEEHYDVVLLQETKCEAAQVEGKLLPAEIVKAYPFRAWCSTQLRKGLSGTAVWSKRKPVRILEDCMPEDDDGRVCALEFPDCVVVSVYVPNSGTKHELRTGRWHEAFTRMIQRLNKFKPAIVCGDFNVVHLDHDIWNPSPNRNLPGLMSIERQQFGSYLKQGYVDAFRALKPHATGEYTWWQTRGGPHAREANKGWRIDYCLLGSKHQEGALKDCFHLPDVKGSDHCPVVVTIDTIAETSRFAMPAIGNKDEKDVAEPPEDVVSGESS